TKGRRAMAKPSRPEAPGDAAGVRVDDQRWKQCTPSEFAWERAALGHLRTLLPNRDPFRAWANAEFLGTAGSVNEIDLLLVTPAGIVILEIKSWSGVLVGDAGTWRQTHRAPADNPVIGAARKARKLRSLLASQQAMRGRRVPWIEGAVFLSDARLEVRFRGGAWLAGFSDPPSPVRAGPAAPGPHLPGERCRLP
ncbi:NERD domain-containing protein, partial [Frankia sp. Cas3]|uniref:NERD domain-containing protein n=1 Tax=Frankia sp. Cas3 TaxID=3073926 RepID=UPI002AD490C6